MQSFIRGRILLNGRTENILLERWTGSMFEESIIKVAMFFTSMWRFCEH